MANRYWVGGTSGDWSSTSSWSTTSGGSGGASVPTSSDNVFFDTNSVTSTTTVTVGDGMLVNNLVCTNTQPLTIDLDFGRIYGDATLNQYVTFDNTGLLDGDVYFFPDSETGNYNLGGFTIKNLNCHFPNPGGHSYNLSGNLNASDDAVVWVDGNVTLASGCVWTFTGAAEVVFEDWVEESNTMDLNDLVINSQASVYFNPDLVPENIDASNVTINFSGSSVKEFGADGLTIGTIDNQDSGDLRLLRWSRTNTIENLILGASTVTRFLEGSTWNINSLTSEGFSGNRAIIRTYPGSGTHDLTTDSPVISSDWLNIGNSHATGSWYAGSNSVDNGGNTGWSFTDAPPVSTNDSSAFLSFFM